MPKQNSAAVETGEWGFCRHCGELVPVQLAPGDRLQARLAKAVAEKQVADGTFLRDPLLRLQEALSDLRMRASVAHAAAIYGLVRGDENMAARPATRELREGLAAALADVFVVEQALAEVVGEPLDLLREAAAHAEHEADRIPGGENGD